MTFNSIWTIINLDTSVPDSTVQGWINAAGIPSCFRFVFSSPFANAWTLNTSYGGSVPMPLAPWTIAVSSNTDPRFNWTVIGLGSPLLHQATIGHLASDSPSEAGARMWHEILHCYGIPADNMQSSERNEFIEYLRVSGSVHYAGFSADPLAYEKSINHTQILIAFYQYLTHKYMGCDCFNEGCNTPDITPDTIPYTPPDTMTDTPPDTMTDTSHDDLLKKILYVAGAIGLLSVLL